MKLSVGIVGLPNVGKSTLFNALLQKQQAYAANYPFATIEPNVGVVPVPDKRLEELASVVSTEEIIPATVTFLDIAGLVKGASEGEGLGNKFLSHIRETSLIVHVLRHFKDSEVVQSGSGDPGDDYLTVETELQLSDLSTLEKQVEPRVNASKEDTKRWEVVLKLREALSSGISARMVDMSPSEKEVASDLFLLTMKPALYVVNISESDVQKGEQIVRDVSSSLSVGEDSVIALSAKMEEDLVGFSEEEKGEYLRSAGLEMTGLEKLISMSYEKLGLISFLTAGEKEVRAWTIEDGMSAPSAAGVIHTDFEKHFIKAKVCSFDDFVEYGGWKGASEKGRVRQEGRDYVVREGDVVEFMVSV